MASLRAMASGRRHLFPVLLIGVAVLLPRSVAQVASASGCTLTCTLTTLSNESVSCTASACAAVDQSQEMCLESMRNVTIAPGDIIALDVGVFPSGQNFLLGNDTLVMLSSASNDSSLARLPSGSCCAVVNVEVIGSGGSGVNLSDACLSDMAITCACASSPLSPQSSPATPTMQSSSATAMPGISMSTPLMTSSSSSSGQTSAGGSSSDGDDDGLGLGAVIGIAVGAGVVLFLSLILVVILCRRRRRSTRGRSASFMKGTSLTFDNPGFVDPEKGSTIQRPVTIRAVKQGHFTSFRDRFSSLRSGEGSSRASTLRSSSPGPKDREHPVYRCERRIDDVVLEKVTDCLEIDTRFRNLMIMLGQPELLEEVKELPEGRNEGDDVLAWLCLKSWRDSTLGTYSSLSRALRNLRLLGPLDELKAAVDVMDDPVPAYNLPASAGILSNTAQDTFINLVEGPDSSFVSTFQRDSRPSIPEEANAGSAPGNGTCFTFVNATAGEHVHDDSAQGVPRAAAGTPPTSPWDKVHLQDQGSSDSVNTQTENPYNTVAVATATFHGPAARPGAVLLDVDKKYKLQPVAAPVAPNPGRDSRNASPGSLNSLDGGGQPPGSADNPDGAAAASGSRRTGQGAEAAAVGARPALAAPPGEPVDRRTAGDEKREAAPAAAAAGDATYAAVADAPADGFEWSPEKQRLEGSADSSLQNPYASIADVQAECAADATASDADALYSEPGKPTPRERARKGPPVQPYQGDVRKSFLTRLSSDDEVNKRFSWSVGDDTKGSGLDPRRRSYVARNPDDDSYAYPDKTQVRASVAVFTIPRTAAEED